MISVCSSSTQQQTEIVSTREAVVSEVS